MNYFQCSHRGHPECNKLYPPCPHNISGYCLGRVDKFECPRKERRAEPQIVAWHVVHRTKIYATVALLALLALLAGLSCFDWHRRSSFEPWEPSEVTEATLAAMNSVREIGKDAPEKEIERLKGQAQKLRNALASTDQNKKIAEIENKKDEFKKYLESWQSFIHWGDTRSIFQKFDDEIARRRIQFTTEGLDPDELLIELNRYIENLSQFCELGKLCGNDGKIEPIEIEAIRQKIHDADLALLDALENEANKIKRGIPKDVNKDLLDKLSEISSSQASFKNIDIGKKDSELRSRAKDFYQSINSHSNAVSKAKGEIGRLLTEIQIRRAELVEIAKVWNQVPISLTVKSHPELAKDLCEPMVGEYLRQKLGVNRPFAIPGQNLGQGKQVKVCGEQPGGNKIVIAIESDPGFQPDKAFPAAGEVWISGSERSDIGKPDFKAFVVALDALAFVAPVGGGANPLEWAAVEPQLPEQDKFIEKFRERGDTYLEPPGNQNIRKISWSKRGQENIQPLPVVFFGGKQPVAPSPFTIKIEEYALTKRILCYTAKAGISGPAVDDFEVWLKSDAGQEALAMKTKFVDQRLNVQPGRLGANFYFANKECALDHKAARDLDRLVDLLNMQNNPKLSVALVGHASTIGPADQNLVFGSARAMQVKTALERKKIPNKVFAFTYGEQLPVLPDVLPDNKTEIEKNAAKNRRVEVWIFNDGNEDAIKKAIQQPGAQLKPAP